MKNLKDLLLLCDETFSILKSKCHEYIIINGNKIETCINLFSDDASKFLYMQELNFCAVSQYVQAHVASIFSGLMHFNEHAEQIEAIKNHKIFSQFAAPNSTNTDFFKAYDLAGTFLFEQYRYNENVGVQEGDICIDGGAFIGDTAIYFAKSGAKEVYSFECDHENIVCAQKNIENFGFKEKVQIINMALSNTIGEINFKHDNENISGGTLCFNKNTNNENIETIQSTTIDRFCNDHLIHPNFIKMDIEGAELDALMGAEKTIKQYKPRLAICIYHTLEHRWEIPLLLHYYMPDYKFYLKKSSPTGETVLFAV